MQKQEEMEIDELAEVGMVDTEEDDESPSNVYEIGYHLVPTLSEDEVGAALKDITGLLKKHNAEIVGDRAPQKIPLAYAIPKRVTGKVLRFNEAYFGWVAFETTRNAIAGITEALDSHKAVLRYIIVRTEKDAVAASLSGAVEVPVVGDIGKPKREAEAGGELSEVALDEALQTMAAEDAKVAE